MNINLNPFILPNSITTANISSDTSVKDNTQINNSSLINNFSADKINEAENKTNIIINELEKLADLAKINIIFNSNKPKKDENKSDNTEEKVIQEGVLNPFVNDYEQIAYYEDNFKHGQVVNPYVYRYKSPWMKYILSEKFQDLCYKLLNNYNPTKKSKEIPLLRATHLKQGDISNCWLIATLGSIANKMVNFIPSIIEVDHENNQYKVYLKGGQDIISLKPEAIKPKVIAKTGAAWAGIIEAAVAKSIGIDYLKQNPDIDIDSLNDNDILYYGYNIMNNGNYCSYAIYYLTGKKTKLRFIRLQSDINQSEMSNWNDKIIVLGNHHYEKIVEGAPEYDLNNDGLVSGHAYSVLDLKNNNDIYLFNPWGEYEPGSNAESFINVLNSKDLCNDGMFLYSKNEFSKKIKWQVYEIVDEMAYGFNSVLHKPLPAPPAFIE